MAQTLKALMLKRNVLFSKALRPSISNVAIVGGGVAGLQAARALQRIGKRVTIFEQNDDFGGVWHHNYDGAALQTELELYQFPEYLIEKHTSFLTKSDIPNKKQLQCGIYDFPNVSQMKNYVHGYANHFNLYQNAQFNTKIVNISPVFDKSSQSENDQDVTAWKITRYVIDCSFCVYFGLPNTTTSCTWLLYCIFVCFVNG